MSLQLLLLLLAGSGLCVDRSRKACKVWDAARSKRKGLTVQSLEELRIKGREKLGLVAGSDGTIRIVLESDGTQVDEDIFFRSVPDHTTFMFLRSDERWTPPGREHSRSALASIPRVVYEALNLLDVHQEAPEWKLMDNHGRLTLVLQWDQVTKSTDQVVTFSDVSKSSSSKEVSEVLPVSSGDPIGHAFTTISRDGRLETTLNNIHPAPSRPTKARSSSIEPPLPTCSKDCEFHCCALHTESRLSRTGSAKRDPKASQSKVRFDDKRRPEQIAQVPWISTSEGMVEKKDSSDSDPEAESYPLEENEAATSEKVLTLIDQLSMDQQKHLSVLDIGIILNRLKAKIIDVKKLEREAEGADCFRWTISATIRGGFLRDLGVLYNGNFYTITEQVELDSLPLPNLEDFEDHKI